jgi:YD repeat-containing protein
VGSTVSISYDNAGRLQTVTMPTGAVTRTYSPTTGQLAALTTSDGQGLAYDHDGPLLRSITWSGTIGGSTSLTYDDSFRATSESVNGGARVGFTYDDDGLLLSAGAMSLTRYSTHGMVDTTTLGNVSDKRTYNQFGELATYEVKQDVSSLFREAVVSRDDLGRIEEKSETIAGVTVTWDYAYDVAGRLWQVMKDGVLVASYEYDANGNRTAAPGLASPPSYDAQDRLISYGAISYAYRPTGELEARTAAGAGTTSYTYDALGNLRRVDLPDGHAIE